MSLLNIVRKPLVAAVLGAFAIGVPVSALYAVSATRAAAAAETAAASPAGPATAAPSAAGPTVALPDFSAMVQHYGPAVVNITVVTKQNAMNEGDDEGEQGDNGGNENSSPDF